jgi:hypothetical protein
MYNREDFLIEEQKRLQSFTVVFSIGFYYFFIFMIYYVIKRDNTVLAS